MNLILLFVQYRKLIYIGAVVILFAGYSAWVWERGNIHGTAKLDAYILAENEAKVKEEKKEAQIVTVIQEKIVEKVRTIKVKGDTIYETIPTIVHGPCVVSNGFVRNYNAAAENTAAPAPLDTDGAPSGYSEAEVAEADVTNLTTLAICRTKLAGVIDVYEQIRKARE